MARTGRRPGDSGTRTAILEAARASFSACGYDGATIRGIAGEAGVDPALVHHYFGAKRDLFVAVMRLPIDPAAVVAHVLSGDAATVGARLVITFLRVWDEPATREPIIALIRSAVTHPGAAQMLREFITREIFGAVAQGLAVDQPQLRATLVGSQLIGLAMMRFVLEVEPLASADRDALVALLAPTIQRYLTGDLGPG